MNAGEHHLQRASLAAARAQQLLAQPATLDGYDWALVASLLAEADDELRRAREHDGSIQLPLLHDVVDELREATLGFTNPSFLRATKAARRHKPALFVPSH